MAKPLGIHSAALALAGMWNISMPEIHTRLEQLNALAVRLVKPT
ncbi:Transcriptional regulator, IclR family [Cronobacter dublinensis 582]|nr:Transcriptional regulator, IclR family [Cronobacter dublinensis 582]